MVAATAEEPDMADAAPQIPLTDRPALATADVISLAEVAARRAEKFGQMIDTLDAGIAKRADKAAAVARREVVANSETARWDHLRELQAAADSLSTTALLWASPVTVLARAGLGTPERTAYSSSLGAPASWTVQGLW